MTPPASNPSRILSTADERREAVIQAAMRLFAQTGMHTSTLAVAKAAGISQAYLFRLFPTKDDLVVAVARRCHDRIHDTFAAVIARATQAGEDPLEAMGASYVELMGDRELLTLQLHAQAASIQHEAVRDVSREAFRRLVGLIHERTEATDEEIKLFMAYGMLINVMTAIDAGAVDEDWARIIARPGPPCDADC